GQTYVGLAPRYFCWDASGKLVGEKAPLGEVPGLVAAKLVDELDGRQVAVEVPDGTVLAVKEEQVKDRPTPILPPGHRSTAGGTRGNAHMYLSDRDLTFVLDARQLIIDPPPKEIDTTSIDTTSIDLRLDTVEEAKVWDVEGYAAQQRQAGVP